MRPHIRAFIEPLPACKADRREQHQHGDDLLPVEPELMRAADHRERGAVQLGAERVEGVVPAAQGADVERRVGAAREVVARCDSCRTMTI